MFYLSSGLCHIDYNNSGQAVWSVIPPRQGSVVRIPPPSVYQLLRSFLGRTFGRHQRGIATTHIDVYFLGRHQRDIATTHIMESGRVVFGLQGRLRWRKDDNKKDSKKRSTPKRQDICSASSNCIRGRTSKNGFEKVAALIV